MGDSTIVDSTVIVFSVLGGSAMRGSVVDVYSILGYSVGSSTGCSITTTTIGATSRIEVEAVGCSELVTELTSRLRTSDCRPCSSSDSSRSTIGICVFEAELVV